MVERSKALMFNAGGREFESNPTFSFNFSSEKDGAVV